MMTILLIYFYLILSAIAIQTQRKQIAPWLYFTNFLPICILFGAGLLHHLNWLSGPDYYFCMTISLCLAWVIRPLNGHFIFGRIHFSHLVIHGMVSLGLIYLLLK